MLVQSWAKVCGVIGKGISHDGDVAADDCGKLRPAEQESAPRAKCAVEILVVAAVARIRCCKLRITNGPAPTQCSADEPKPKRCPWAARIGENRRSTAKNCGADNNADDDADRVPQAKPGCYW